MIYTVVVDRFIATNCYIYASDKTKRGWIIDPGAEADKLLRFVADKGITIEKILLTHGHFDHISAAPQLQQAWGGIEICMQKNGCQYAQNPQWNLSAMNGEPVVLDHVTYIEDDSEIVLSDDDSMRVRMLPVPGHTSDGCLYYSEADGVAFVGDSVFRDSYGRTDMYGGDEETLLHSIVANVLTLPDDTVLLNGHTEPTTVAYEKKQPWYQPYLGVKNK